ncbi:Rha family transcriptional regulator [Pseudomonas coleopterorum]|uniref:Rha family transcriptional regulator n=1 Tax=Pseudomonas coleopterorum TaxID=1605838 RepID=UPI00089CF992|nr:Rha family transcriptional regulator [Pseudomonas coleopterorum]SEE39622.1 Phage regulatory protein Rha (Phage_pRha) [Pseudomonas coleopterorum]
MTESNRKAKGLSSPAPQNDGDENVARTMSSREIAKLTGKRHDHVMRDIRNMLTELKITDPSFGGSYLDGSGRLLPCFNLDRELTETLVTGYSVPLRHKVIRRLRELEEQAVTPPKKINGAKVNGEIAIFECYTRLLKPSPSSQMAMLNRIAANNGLESSFLPGYAIDAAPDATGGSSMRTLPLTDLLKEQGIRSTARVFNRHLESRGIIKKCQRNSAKRGVVEFWSITEKGLHFGKNLTSPNSPRETQPHWYVERFAELVELIGEGRL